MKKGMFSIRLSKVGMLSLVAERHTLDMNSMRAMAHLPAHSPGDRALLRPFLNCQKLSRSFDDALLALERVVFVDQEFRVVPEEQQIPRGEVRVRACFKTQRC